MSISLKKILHSVFPKRISSTAHARLLIRNSLIFAMVVASAGVLFSFLFRYDIVTTSSFEDGWMNAFIYGPIAYFLLEKEKIAVWAALIYTFADQSYAITNGLFPSLISVTAMIVFASALRGIYYLKKNATSNFSASVSLQTVPADEKIAS